MKSLILQVLSLPIVIWACTNKSVDKLAYGRLDRYEALESKYVAPRNVDVWLPDDYDPANQYHVLYMHDGQMLFDSTSTWNRQEWGIDETMGKMIAQQKIDPMIVVAIWNTGNRHSEYFPQKPFEMLDASVRDSIIEYGTRPGSNQLFRVPIQSDAYLKFIIEELKPTIDSIYSTYQDPDHTMIAGSSMGGLISMYAICEYPEIFSAAACLSTHWLGTFETAKNPFPALFATYLDTHLPDPGTHKIYFDFGTETLDQYYEPYQKQIDSIMKANGYNDKNWTTRKFEGADHSERAWNNRMEDVILFLTD